MSDTDLVLVFDLLEAGYKNWWFPATGLIFVAVGIVLVRFPKPFMALTGSSGRPRFYTVFSKFLLGFSVFWVVAAFVATFGEYLLVRSAYVNGDFKTVEGKIEHFQPMPVAGRADESFEVAGQDFAYSDFSVTAGFNTTRAYGGPLDDGVRVRIAHVRGMIVRLEVERRAVEAAARRPHASFWSPPADAYNFPRGGLIDLSQRYYWVVISGLILLYAAVWRWRGRGHIARDPSLRTGYNRLTGKMALWACFLVVTAAATSLFGAEYPIEIHGQLVNSYDPVMVVAIGIVIARWNYWTFFQDGVAKMAKHPGLVDQEWAARLWPRLAAAYYVIQICLGFVF